MGTENKTAYDAYRKALIKIFEGRVFRDERDDLVVFEGVICLITLTSPIMIRCDRFG